MSLVTLHIQTQFTSTGGLSGAQEAAMLERNTIFMPNDSVIIIIFSFVTKLQKQIVCCLRWNNASRRFLAKSMVVTVGFDSQLLSRPCCRWIFWWYTQCSTYYQCWLKDHLWSVFFSIYQFLIPYCTFFHTPHKRKTESAKRWEGSF